MTIGIQILLVLALLAGLIAPFIGNKTWHWSQLVLVVCIALAGIGFLFLGAETVRTHHVLRAKIPKLENDLKAADELQDTLINGSGDTPGTLDLEHRLQMISRDRGRVWRNVMPVGDVSDQGQVEIEISQPKPHSLANGSIIFAFEANPPASDDAPAPFEASAGKQYLGEFRVIKVKGSGVVLEPVQLINQRTGQRLLESQGPWSLYETMPADRHSIFADMAEEELRQLIPPESIEEYVRHGTPVTADDNEFDRIGLDENDQLLGPDDFDKAVKFLYDRPLHDYAYLFAELAQKRVLLRTKIQGITEDNARVAESIESAKRLGKFRQQQKESLTTDLTGMKQDRQAIESHRDLLLRQLTNAQQKIDQTLAGNFKNAKLLTERQLNRIQLINSTAPAPAGAESPTP